MRFADFLRTTVLISMAAASVLAAITLAGAASSSDQLLVPIAAGWWIVAGLIGLWFGRRNETSSPIASLLASARMQASLPEVDPARTVLNRLWPLLVCTIYDAIPGLPPEFVTALGLFNDVIVREAIQHGLAVLDLRMICTEPADYSAISPIEPSSQGGAKLAASLVAVMVKHDFSVGGCQIY